MVAPSVSLSNANLSHFSCVAFEFTFLKQFREETLNQGDKLRAIHLFLGKFSTSQNLKKMLKVIANTLPCFVCVVFQHLWTNRFLFSTELLDPGSCSRRDKSPNNLYSRSRSPEAKERPEHGEKKARIVVSNARDNAISRKLSPQSVSIGF